MAQQITETGKMGDYGHLVLPRTLRKKYKLEKGSHVVWIDTGETIILKPLEIPQIAKTKEEPNEFEAALKNADLTPEQWEEGRKQAARKLLKEMYGLDYDTLTNA